MLILRIHNRRTSLLRIDGEQCVVQRSHRGFRELLAQATLVGGTVAAFRLEKHGGDTAQGWVADRSVTFLHAHLAGLGNCDGERCVSVAAGCDHYVIHDPDVLAAIEC